MYIYILFSFNDMHVHVRARIVCIKAIRRVFVHFRYTTVSSREGSHLRHHLLKSDEHVQCLSFSAL